MITTLKNNMTLSEEKKDKNELTKSSNVNENINKLNESKKDKEDKISNEKLETNKKTEHIPKELFYPTYLEKYKEHRIEHVHDKELKGKIERHNLHSTEFDNKRDIDVYLPPSYYENLTKKYPVLYMHDGNNLFYSSIAFGGVPWKVDRTLEKLFEKDLMHEIIVVGIHNTIGRNHEYTWTEMQFINKKEGGGGKKYADFITKTIKPFIDSKYRTLSDRENTAIMGSSLGGLISYYLGLHYSDTFGNIGIISPSFWWGNGQAFRDFNKMKTDLKIWLDMGYKEGRHNTNNSTVGLHILNIRKMKALLSGINYKEGHNLGYLEDEEGLHNEHSWAKRFHLTMLFFFGK
jgi:predicted alpha/beta superfamily hydrolase